jgi:hypothetical protein
MILQEAINHFGVDVDEHHERELDIPVLDGVQAQGDVIVVPVDHADHGPVAEHRVGHEGVIIVKGENGGHTHLLLASGDVAWFPNPRAGVTPDDLALGVLVVADGATGYLAHPEHAYSGIAPGTYIVNRQREAAADAVRFVAD